MTQGPNVKRLIVEKMSTDMVAAGENFSGILGILQKPGSIGDAARKATEWVEVAISAVKSAPNNPYGDDDEAIAAVILKGIEDRKPR